MRKIVLAGLQTTARGSPRVKSCGPSQILRMPLHAEGLRLKSDSQEDYERDVKALAALIGDMSSLDGERVFQTYVNDWEAMDPILQYDVTLDANEAVGGRLDGREAGPQPQPHYHGSAETSHHRTGFTTQQSQGSHRPAITLPPNDSDPSLPGPYGLGMDRLPQQSVGLIHEIPRDPATILMADQVPTRTIAPDLSIGGLLSLDPLLCLPAPEAGQVTCHQYEGDHHASSRSYGTETSPNPVDYSLFHSTTSLGSVDTSLGPSTPEAVGDHELQPCNLFTNPSAVETLDLNGGELTYDLLAPLSGTRKRAGSDLGSSTTKRPSPYPYAAGGGFPYGGNPAAAAAMFGAGAAPAGNVTPYMTPMPQQALLDPVAPPGPTAMGRPGGGGGMGGDSVIGRPGQQEVDMCVGKWFPGTDYAPTLDHLVFNIVKPPVMEIHPLLRPIADTRDSSDPFLVFDVLFPPNTIHVSNEPPRKSWSKGRKDLATFPRLKLIRLVTRYTAWVIQVSTDSPAGITVADVIDAIHDHYRVNASEEDSWGRTDPGTQSEILMAYKWNRSTDCLDVTS
ncbi:hypothetical protein FRB90_004195 [Tulasnella sp. 427]|nr:hypothetical protein FRB90_004195 [Tulasnella sp. 427]